LPDAVRQRGELSQAELDILRARLSYLMAKMSRRDSMGLDENAALAVIQLFLSPGAAPLSLQTLEWMIGLHLESLEAAGETLGASIVAQVRGAYENAYRFLMQPERRTFPRELHPGTPDAFRRD
jgi:hypothetical protein